MGDERKDAGGNANEIRLQFCALYATLKLLKDLKKGNGFIQLLPAFNTCYVTSTANDVMFVNWNVMKYIHRKQKLSFHMKA